MTTTRWVILIGILVLAVGGLALWLGIKLGQKDTTDIINRPGDTGTPATPFTPGEPSAGFQTGDWTELLQGRDGVVQVSYGITGLAKERIGTKLDFDSTLGHEIIFRNIADNPAHMTYIATWRDKGGDLIDTITFDRIFNPGEEDFLDIGKRGATELKISAEAK
ncbi:MAG: hypothetical protein AAB037_00880 [Chloroflexota bacterium]